MATPSTLHEALGLPSAADVEEAKARMQERFPELTEWGRAFDEGVQELGERTGLPTYHDVFAGTERLQEWLEGRENTSEVEVESTDEEPASEEESESEDDGLPWWVKLLGAAAVAYYVYEKLGYEVTVSEDIEFEIPAFEIDGIPWTVERTRVPGPPMAARIADPLLHGGVAVPGPGSADVKISGRGALTVDHIVGACPMPHVSGLPHLPMTGRAAWRTTNGSVYVNGAPLLRAGDWVIEHLGGNNPIIAGAPRVLAGPPGAPCVVQEVTHRRLSEFVPYVERIGSVGGKYSVKATVSWSLRDMLGGAAAAGLAYLGGPVGMWGARAMLGLIDGPTLKIEFNAEATGFVDFYVPIDIDRDGTVDGVLEARQKAKVTGESEHSAVLDPKKPGKAKNSKEGDLEVDVDVERPEVKWTPSKNGE